MIFSLNWVIVYRTISLPRIIFIPQVKPIVPVRFGVSRTTTA
jgi:hypothetical protein